MIYDMRTYDIAPGKVPDYMAAAGQVALPIRQEYDIKLGGWYHSEIGRLNQVVHIWAYNDLDHLREATTAVRNDTRWINDYIPRIRGLVVGQADQIMFGADFSPDPTAGGQPASTPTIYDMRIYDIKLGMVPEYMAAVREVGLPIRQEIDARLAGWFYSEVGPLNQVVHIWAYKGYEDMAQKVKAYSSDPRWISEYIPRVVPVLAAQRDQLMHGADFFPGPY